MHKISFAKGRYAASLQLLLNISTDTNPHSEEGNKCSSDLRLLHTCYIFVKHAAFSKTPVSKDCEESKGRVPRPVLGSRTALFGLGLRPLLLTRVLGGVSVGVPRLRGRALRAFWDIESGWVFTPLHLTAK